MRPSLSHIQSAASISSPRTPNRANSSTFSSPSVSTRSEADPVILEFGSRFVKAGFAGDTLPLYCLGYGTSEQQRAGDYRQWEVGNQAQRQNNSCTKQNLERQELWRMDLRTVDLGLVEDRIERAVRQLFTRCLVTDSKSRRVLLVLPPALPHALIAVLLTILFNNFQCPNITLLSGPVLSTVAAGLRSSLTVDVGWAETVVTAVYEYREVHCRRSVRAGKLLLQEMASSLAEGFRKTQDERRAQESQTFEKVSAIDISVEETEETLTRFAWCRAFEIAENHQDPANISIQGSSNSEVRSSEVVDATARVRLQSTLPPTELHIPFISFADVTEAAFFAHNRVDGYLLDDEELPLGLLAYHALLSLPVDVRAICMSRIVVVGGCSHIPGIKRRIVDEVARLVEQQGWEKGSRKESGPPTNALKGSTATVVLPNQPEDVNPMNQSSAVDVNGLSPALAEPGLDPISINLDRSKAKKSKAVAQGAVRGIESLGSWAGASLVAGLRVKGVVEIEKDRFLQHGLLGASRYQSHLC